MNEDYIMNENYTLSCHLGNYKLECNHCHEAISVERYDPLEDARSQIVHSTDCILTKFR